MEIFEAKIMELPLVLCGLAMTALIITIFINKIQIKKKIIAGTFLFFIAANGLAFILTFRYIDREITRDKQFKTVTGEVLLVDYKNIIISYRFYLVNKEYLNRVKVPLKTGGYLEKGNKITVYYLPTKPEENYPRGYQKTWQKNIPNKLVELGISCIVGLILGVCLTRISNINE